MLNGVKNHFFPSKGENVNRYQLDEFDPTINRGTSNVFMISNRINTGSKVLDLGCGTGVFARTLKENECTVFGVDLDQEAVRYARKTELYERVICANLAEFTSQTLMTYLTANAPFDVIIMSDILEHLPEPTDVLVHYAQYLTENGQIFISVPNIAHADISLHLMNGIFNYTNMGVLDNTHVKFFTKTSFAQWIEQINESYEQTSFDCEYIGATFYSGDILDDIRTRFPVLYRALGQYENFNALQIVFCLTLQSKHEEPKKLKLLLEEAAKNVWEMIGETLQGVSQRIPNEVALCNPERFYYEDTIYKMNRTIADVKNNLKWHGDKVFELNSEIERYQSYQKELTDQNHLYSNQINLLNSEIEKHQSYQRELNENYNSLLAYVENETVSIKKYEEKQEEVIKKSQRILEIESSKIWKILKAFKIIK